jgi:restriction system protein
MSSGLPWDNNSWEVAAEIAAHRHRVSAAVLAATTGVTETPLPAIPTAALSISSLIIPERSVAEGVLIRSVSVVWNEIVQRLGSDWSLAYQLTPRQWEELIAGALQKDKEIKFDEVILTPMSRDHGRDVIAIKNGRMALKIIGSVKKYKPGHLVDYDAIRALMGVMGSERDVSKGLITTTSDFPPEVWEDPLIKPLIPTKLELINGDGLQKWLAELAASSKP